MALENVVFSKILVRKTVIIKQQGTKDLNPEKSAGSQKAAKELQMKYLSEMHCSDCKTNSCWMVVVCNRLFSTSLFKNTL